MKVAILGGYGLIGSACLRALKKAGCEVVGVGRSSHHARRTDPDIPWVITDITKTSVEAWRKHLVGVEVVVNASGLLQGDKALSEIHVDAIRNLTAALAGTDTHLIQISAAGVSETASTAFFRTKSDGDAILLASSINWTILRPTLVLSPQAYGGTAILRAISAFPLLQMQVFADAPVQTVSVKDVAQAVVSCTTGDMPSHEIYELTESGTQTFGDLTRYVRAWLGFKPWRSVIAIPSGIARSVGVFADIAGLFGWRSPLRRTSLKVMETGITGDPSNWLANGGAPMRPLTETLAALPATTQERWFAQLYLLLPLVILALAIFWIATGLITFAHLPESIAILTNRGASESVAQIAVVGGACLDLVLGVAVLFRRTARRACFWMAGLSASYMIVSTVTAPDLWVDPLGPFLKILPIIVLCLMTAAILDER